MRLIITGDLTFERDYVKKRSTLSSIWLSTCTTFSRFTGWCRLPSSWLSGTLRPLQTGTHRKSSNQKIRPRPSSAGDAFYTEVVYCFLLRNTNPHFKFRQASELLFFSGSCAVGVERGIIFMSPSVRMGVLTFLIAAHSICTLRDVHGRNQWQRLGCCCKVLHAAEVLIAPLLLWSSQDWQKLVTYPGFHLSLVIFSCLVALPQGSLSHWWWGL